MIKKSEESDKKNLLRQMENTNQHNPNPQECVGKVKMVKVKKKTVNTDLRF